MADDTTMHVPVPRNRLVALTLAGVLLTTIVAGALAFPGTGLVAQDGSPAASDATPTGGVAADAPTPNENYTVAVQTRAGGGEYGEDHDEAHGEDDEEYDEGEEEHEEGDEAHEDEDA